MAAPERVIGRWRSPLRGPGLTAILGMVLLVTMGIVVVTGFLSHAAYQPGLPGNAIVDPDRDLPIPFSWPSSPTWLYAVTQGLHVTIGYVTIPVLLAKLWSVMPRLFVWPPVSSPAMALERLSIGLLVSSAVFQLATGVANAQYWYPFHFDFVQAHYWGAVVFTGAFVLHFLVKLPVVVRAYRRRGLKHTELDPDLLVSRDPSPSTISRRGMLGATGAAAGLVLLGNAGQVLGGPLRKTAFLSPRREDFPVNKPFGIAGIDRTAVGPDWRLRLGDRELTRDELLALPQRTHDLPIACVEGWTVTRTWTGVPLRDLARLAGVPDATQLTVESLQPRGRFRRVSLGEAQVQDPRSLLALRVEGEDLSLDHGYPARIIVPALPGVHNTKWVGRLSFS